DLELPRFRGRLRNGQSFVVLGVGLLLLSETALAKAKGKGVFPLLGRAFRINVSVPNHQCSYKWVWHPSAGKRDIAEAFISQVSLPNVDYICGLSERTMHAFWRDYRTRTVVTNIMS